jgi:hypothetical protein
MKIKTVSTVRSSDIFILIVHRGIYLMTKATFTTTVTQEPGMNATGLQVPSEAVAAMGKGKRPPVVVSVGGHSYRSTVTAYAIPSPIKRRNGQVGEHGYR